MKSATRTNLKTSEKLAPWLHQYFYRLNKNHNFNYVIEGYHMFPKDMAGFKHKNDFTILYLAYPKLNPKQIFDELRKHETKKDWTYGMPDKQLLNECELFSHISKMIETDCKKYEFTFYDVSFNRNVVLKEIFSTLTK